MGDIATAVEEAVQLALAEVLSDVNACHRTPDPNGDLVRLETIRYALQKRIDTPAPPATDDTSEDSNG